MKVYDSRKLRMAKPLHPDQRKEIMDYFRRQAEEHEKKTVKETFEVEFAFTEEDIQKAKKWEEEHHYKYDDVKPLLLDAYNAGVIECPRRQIF